MATIGASSLKGGKNVAKKSTTKPPGFMKRKNGSIDSQGNMSSPASNSSDDAACSARTTTPIEQICSTAPSPSVMNGDGECSDQENGKEKRKSPIGDSNATDSMDVGVRLKVVPPDQDVDKTNGTIRTGDEIGNRKSKNGTCSFNEKETDPVNVELPTNKCDDGDVKNVQCSLLDAHVLNHGDSSSGLHTQANDSLSLGKNAKESFKGILEKAVSKVNNTENGTDKAMDTSPGDDSKEDMNSEDRNSEGLGIKSYNSSCDKTVHSDDDIEMEILDNKMKTELEKIENNDVVPPGTESTGDGCGMTNGLDSNHNDNDLENGAPTQEEDCDTIESETETSKKRAGSPCVGPTDVKKSRLDSVIGRLCSQTGIKPDDIEEGVVSPENEDPTDSLSEQSVTSSEATSDDKKIHISKKKLIDIIEKKVASIIHSTKNASIAQLEQRVKELSSANETWKAQVQELKTEIIDITVLHQRHERRRTSQSKVQTRNMGIQVDDGKVQAARQGLVQHVSAPSPRGGTVAPRPAPPAATAVAAAPVPIAPATTRTMLIPVSSTGSLHSGQPVTLLAPSSLNPATSNVHVGSQIRMISTPSAPSAQNLPPGNQTVRQMLELKKQSPVAAGQAKAGGVIDLTDDDDVNKSTATRQVMSVAVAQQGVRPAMPITGLQPGAFVLKGASGPMILQPIANTQVRGHAPGSSAIIYRPNVVVQGQQGITAVRPVGTLPSVRPVASHPYTTSRLVTPVRTNRPSQQHPAPLPCSAAPQTIVPGKPMPPRPTLKINRVQQGIVLSWNMATTEGLSDITNYQLFAYQEGMTPPNSNLWKKVGDVKALPLPMACTLTQFQVGNKYHFAVRAVDSYGRIGDFSEPSSIHLEKR